MWVASEHILPNTFLTRNTHTCANHQSTIETGRSWRRAKNKSQAATKIKRIKRKKKRKRRKKKCQAHSMSGMRKWVKRINKCRNIFEWSHTGKENEINSWQNAWTYDYIIETATDEFICTHQIRLQFIFMCVWSSHFVHHASAKTIYSLNFRPFVLTFFSIFEHVKLQKQLHVHKHATIAFTKHTKFQTK